MPKEGMPPYSRPLMDILIGILTVVEVLVCLLMILIVLMQRPRQEGLGASFGDGAMTQLVGAQTTNVLQKGTVYLAVLLFVLTISLAVLTTKRQAAKSGQKIFTEPPAPAAVIPTPAPVPAPAGQTPAAPADAAKAAVTPAATAVPAAPAAPVMKEPTEAAKPAAPAVKPVEAAPAPKPTVEAAKPAVEAPKAPAAPVVVPVVPAETAPKP